MSEPDYVARNREVWTKTNAEYTDAAAREGWADGGIRWGVFGVREDDVRVLGDGHGEWIDLLHSAGLEVERLVELYAPDGARTHEYYDGATAEWAGKWPAEDLWAARKRG